MSEIIKQIRKAFENLARKTTGIMGSAQIMDAGADLRDIAEKLYREREEAQETIRDLRETVKSHSLLLYLVFRYLTGDASQGKSNKDYLIEKIQEALFDTAKEK